MIAIILDDVGSDARIVRESMLRLPKELAYAIIPHRPAAKECAFLLKEADFDIMCHLPMEPFDRRREDDDGGLVKVGMDRATVERIVSADIDAVPFAIGVNNHEGSRATTDAGLMEFALDVIRAKGLFFVDSRTSPKSIADRVSRRMGIPTASRDVFLDDEPDPVKIEEQFRRLLALARKNGRALAIGHVRSSTLDALETMFAKLPEERVRLVRIRDYVAAGKPVSATR